MSYARVGNIAPSNIWVADNGEESTGVAINQMVTPNVVYSINNDGIVNVRPVSVGSNYNGVLQSTTFPARVNDRYGMGYVSSVNKLFIVNGNKQLYYANINASNGYIESYVYTGITFSETYVFLAGLNDKLAVSTGSAIYYLDATDLLNNSLIPRNSVTFTEGTSIEYGPVGSFAVSADTIFFPVASSGIKMFNLSGSYVATFHAESGTRVDGLCISRDGNFLITTIIVDADVVKAYKISALPYGKVYTFPTIGEKMYPGDQIVFEYSGRIETIQLPLSVNEIELFAHGAGGGGADPGTGGNGGICQGRLSLSKINYAPLYISVGQGGIYSNGGSSISDAFGGGARGFQFGGSGGGATDVRLSPASLTSRILIAGGGGGGSDNVYGGNHGGGLTAPTVHGGGGTQSSGGAGHNGGSTGSLGFGGYAGGGDNAGGGGGGGYYGGGGGSSDNSCGGGGSSYYDTSVLTNYSTTVGGGAAAGSSTAGSGAARNGANGRLIMTIVSGTLTQTFLTEDLSMVNMNALKKENIDYVRNKVNLFRTSNAMPAISWTDPLVVALVTPIKALHWNEIENSIVEVYKTKNMNFNSPATRSMLEEQIEKNNPKHVVTGLGGRINNIFNALKNK